jgi:DNA replication protein DnaC
MNIETVKQQLRELRLKVAATELDEILLAQKKTISLDWISSLLSAEIDARRASAVESRIRRAEFPEITTLEAFNWDFNPDINRSLIEELATLEFVHRRDVALFLGKPGTGKTHLALALGVRAVHSGVRVYCSSMKRLAAQIASAKSRNALDGLFKRILGARLWIIDDWGVVSMRQDIAEEVFDLLDRRRHSSALILTSNRDVDEWGTVFPDPVLASAAIDRLFHNAHIATFNGNSYRLAGRIALSSPNRSKKSPGGDLENSN